MEIEVSLAEYGVVPRCSRLRYSALKSLVLVL